MEIRRPVYRTPLFCSCRLILSVVSCLGFVNLYILRFNLTLAMSCMVNHTANQQILKMSETRPNTHDVQQQRCNGDRLNAGVISRQPETLTHNDGSFVWSYKTQSILSSSFFCGYLITQIPGGLLSQRFGGKKFFGRSMLVCSIATLLIPLIAQLSYVALIILRIFLGACQGVALPAMSVVWSRWAPPLERQKLGSLCYAGIILGMVINFPITGMLCDSGRWQDVFYISGCLGILWFCAWSYFVFDSPEIHPHISEAEKAYICYSLRKYISMSLQEQPPTPWKSLLTSSAVWALVTAGICSDFTLYIQIGSIGNYMHDVHYFNHVQVAVVSAMPYAGFFLLTIISGTLYDLAIARRVCSRTTARKTGTTIGMLIPAVLMFFVGFLDCSYRLIAVLLLVTSGTLCGLQIGAGFITSFSEIAPQHAGVVFGIVNTFATTSGIIAPVLIANITSDHTQSQWQIVFTISAFLCIFGSIVYIIYGSGKVQKWDVLPPDRQTDIDMSVTRSLHPSEENSCETLPPITSRQEMTSSSLQTSLM